MKIICLTIVVSLIFSSISCSDANAVKPKVESKAEVELKPDLELKAGVEPETNIEEGKQEYIAGDQGWTQFEKGSWVVWKTGHQLVKRVYKNTANDAEDASDWFKIYEYDTATKKFPEEPTSGTASYRPLNIAASSHKSHKSHKLIKVLPTRQGELVIEGVKYACQIKSYRLTLFKKKSTTSTQITYLCKLWHCPQIRVPTRALRSIGMGLTFLLPVAMENDVIRGEMSTTYKTVCKNKKGDQVLEIMSETRTVNSQIIALKEVHKINGKWVASVREKIENSFVNRYISENSQEKVVTGKGKMIRWLSSKVPGHCFKKEGNYETVDMKKQLKKQRFKSEVVDFHVVLPKKKLLPQKKEKSPVEKTPIEKTSAITPVANGRF